MCFCKSLVSLKSLFYSADSVDDTEQNKQLETVVQELFC